MKGHLCSGEDVMKPLSFNDLARLPVVHFYQRAFHQATGVSLRMVAPEGGTMQRHFGPSQNPFCSLLATEPVACAACVEAESCAKRKAANKLCTQQVHCYAGLTIIATPVIVVGSHVATLLSGQVLRREPTDRDFLLVMRMIGAGSDSDWIKKARKAYFETPVLSPEQLLAAVQLLEVFAQYLAEAGNRQVLACSELEPKAVSSAKEFVQSHVQEPITLGLVVQHVNVNRFHFCKLFKKSTGMTLTEYVGRVRVEKAKLLLCDPSRRISEVVFAAGFGSIPRFNCVFKQYVGMPPTEYRATLRGH